MPQHGLIVYSQYGREILSTSKICWSHVDFFYVAANTYQFKNYPDAEGFTLLAIQIMVNQPWLDRRSYTANLTTSGTTVTVQAGTVDIYVMVLMQ